MLISHSMQEPLFFETFIFANSIKAHIWDTKNLRQERDLPISENYRVILLIHEDFIFTKLCIYEVSRKQNTGKNFQIYKSFYFRIIEQAGDLDKVCINLIRDHVINTAGDITTLW